VLPPGVNDPELLELDELLELEPDDDELDDEELDDELDDEDADDDEDELELLELDPPPVVGAAGESPHAALNPAAARNVPCDNSIRKSRRAFSVASRSSRS